MASDKDIRRVFREIRSQLQISQGTAGAKIGVSAATLSRWESGDGELSEKQLDDLADYLDAEVIARSEKETGSFAGPMSRSIKRFRLRHGITQVELAKAARMSQASISLIENGHIKLDEEDDKRIVDALDSLAPRETKTVSLRSLLNPQAFALEQAQERIRQLEELHEKATHVIETGHGVIERTQQRIRELEELHASDQHMIEGYRKLHETDLKIIEILQETGPGSAAMDGVHALEEIQRLRAENAELRSWLNAEEVAAIANARAAELREQVTEKVSAEPTGEEE